MKSIYDAAHATDAQLVKDLLQAHGLAAFVRGEFLQGGVGELPIGGMVQVCVADGDAARARSIVEDWQQAEIAPDGLPEDEVAQAVTTGPQSTAGASSRLGLGILVGAAIGAALTWAVMRVPDPRPADYNGDGRFDEQTVALGEGRMALEMDRNSDGEVDEVFTFERGGQLSLQQSDDDFDGRMESRTRYRNGLWAVSVSDLDGDGQSDRRTDAINGVVATEEWLDRQQNVVKRVHFQGGRAIAAEVDTDGDGKLDARHEYDDREEPRRQ